jgi:hypothetical protein
MGTNRDNQHPRVDYDFKAKSKKLLEENYAIAEKMLAKARELCDSGEDVRSNDTRPGLATLQHCASKAIDEIVRLTPLAVENEDQRMVGQSLGAVGWAGVAVESPDNSADA